MSVDIASVDKAHTGFY